MELEVIRVELEKKPERVWLAPSIPFLFRGVVVSSELSGQSLSHIIETYSESVQPLDEHCRELGVKAALVLQLAKQYPQIAEELNFAEEVRARMLEAKALAPYTGSIPEVLEHIKEEKFDKNGNAVVSYSSAAASALRNMSNQMFKAAAIADRKRYGESSDSSGVTVNVGVQNNVQAGPQSLEELREIPLTDLINDNRPGEN